MKGKLMSIPYLLYELDYIECSIEIIKYRDSNLIEICNPESTCFFPLIVPTGSWNSKVNEDYTIFIQTVNDIIYDLSHNRLLSLLLFTNLNII